VNYKDLIKSRKLRLKILSLLSFIPDKIMISLQYRIKTGRKINWKNPKRFTEKIQIYKLEYRTDLMKMCVNKFSVREYVRECGLEDILIPIVGCYDQSSNINYSLLPEQFVAKDTLGGGGGAVLICKDKSTLDKKRTNKLFDEWTNSSTSYRVGGREWPYGGQKHQIIIESMLPSDEAEGGLIDYKFFCTYGKVEFLYVIADRKIGVGAGLGIFDSNFKKLKVLRKDESPLKRNINKPKNFEHLKKCAEILSEPFPEARIDLYSVEGKTYFGEITFFDGSGYMKFEPDVFDFIFGEKFNI